MREALSWIAAAVALGALIGIIRCEIRILRVGGLAVFHARANAFLPVLLSGKPIFEPVRRILLLEYKLLAVFFAMGIALMLLAA